MTREKRYSVRFAAAGGDTVKAELRGIGTAGREAMDGLRDGSGPAAAGLDRVGDAAAQAQAKLEAIVAKSTAALAAMRSSAQASSPLVDRINRATGVTPDLGQSTADYLRQGQALDDMRAKFNPVFAAIRTYRAEVSSIRAAHLEGAISADEMTAAINRARTASLDSIAAFKGRSRSIDDMSKSTRASAFRMQMLGYQINDIGVSLAGGMNPFTVLAQQGTQVAQIYGAGNGGVGGLFRDLGGMIRGAAMRFPLLTAAVAVGSAAVAGMQHEINKAKGVTVGFGDTALAVFQVIGRGIYSWIKPGVDKIGEWFSTAWDAVVDGVKWAGNGLINGTKIAVDAIGTAISVIPDLFRSAFSFAVSFVLTKLHDMVWHVAQAVNAIAKALNDVFGTNLSTSSLDGLVSSLSKSSGEYYKGGVDAKDRVEKAWDGFEDRRDKIAAEDPMGDFYSAVRRQAIKNSKDKDDGKGGKQKDAVDDLVKSLQRELAVLRETDPVKAKMLEYSEKLSGATMGEKEQVLGLVTALENAKNGWESIGISLRTYAEEGKRTGKAVGEALVNGLKGAENQFRNFIETGKFNFKEFIRSIVADLAVIGFRRAILTPIADWFGGLFPAAVSHTGGEVGAGGMVRNVPAALFAGAPRFHGGGWPGLRSDEVPTILQRGERVLSRAEVARGSQSGDGTVHVMVGVDQSGNLVPLIQSVSGRVSAQAVAAGMAAQDRKMPQNLQAYSARRA
ncbi:phage tail length tape measure family protein [Seohaeicola zhoushanensis]|uniref:Bacteriophage tail tape measure C-terminal domain-containing protein n=1 Tax=Seohaeicola zhoushanensis TaxID=1569283 RepID=A0A8J3H1I0_9RHOB|nr:phage tail length tape measure family protein [Seohaeicola zhoushanensis]GHF71195.1 hypothetical protein GCM10017056_47640 [Seohaeicola zhoushanensis]